MALNNAALVPSANTLETTLKFVSLHAGDPGAAGTANPTTAARQPLAWTPATSTPNLSLSAAVHFSGVAADGPATHIALWSAVTAGTCFGTYPLTGDQVANADGFYDLTALHLVGSST